MVTYFGEAAVPVWAIPALVYCDEGANLSEEQYRKLICYSGYLSKLSPNGYMPKVAPDQEGEEERISIFGELEPTKIVYFYGNFPEYIEKY